VNVVAEPATLDAGVVPASIQSIVHQTIAATVGRSSCADVEVRTAQDGEAITVDIACAVGGDEKTLSRNIGMLDSTQALLRALIGPEMELRPTQRGDVATLSLRFPYQPVATPDRSSSRVEGIGEPE